MSLFEILVIPAVLALEYFFPKRKTVFFRKGFVEDLGYLVLSVYCTPIVTDRLREILVRPHGSGLSLKFSYEGVAVFLAGLVLFDFLLYWMHRFVHSVPLLWRSHQLHHSSQELTALSALRNGFFEDVFILLWVTTPMALLGFDRELLNLLSAILPVHGYLVHSNIRFPKRGAWISRVFCTPCFHYIHHLKYLHHAYGQNFSAIFSFWDRWFQTVTESSGQVELGFQGLESYPRNPLARYIYPARFRRPSA